MKDCLPHRHSFKRYTWQKEYEEAKFYPKRFICAANQIGKSTVQICDRLEIAVSPELWPELWPMQLKFNPKVKPYSWYLYPNQDTVMTEFREKWEPFYLPRGEYKDHPIYGWKAHIHNKVLKFIRFNTGYTIYFKTYNQNVSDLQSGTVFAIDLDEEVPEHLIPELEARLFATEGQMSMAFTATLGQEFWRRVIEGTGEEEIWPHAWKKQISMYDCVKYWDGSESPWSIERIHRVERSCKSKAEVLRRVRGRFVVDAGLKYSGFERERNYVRYPKNGQGRYYKGCQKGWSIYSAVDIGSGGENNHPAAMVFMALSPCLTKIRLIRCRRMDGIETTAGDIFLEYKKQRRKLAPVIQAYDWASKDYGTIVARAGESWQKAEKSHELGENAVNTAFKSGMLKIYYDPDDEACESVKLVRELETLTNEINKRHAKDDLIDTVRYCLTAMPIDWAAVLNGEVIKPEDKIKKGSPQDARPNDYNRSKLFDQEETTRIEDEISEWADLY